MGGGREWEEEKEEEVVEEEEEEEKAVHVRNRERERGKRQGERKELMIERVVLVVCKDIRNNFFIALTCVQT